LHFLKVYFYKLCAFEQACSGLFPLQVLAFRGA
jgi:hypothetical protein